MSDQDKLVQERLELRQMEDVLFAEFGGTDWVNKTDQELRMAVAQAQGTNSDPAADSLEGMLGNAARAMDKEVFIENCLMVGRGMRVSFFSDKSRQFFSIPDTHKRCIKLAQNTSEVADLESKLGVVLSAP